MSAGAQISSAAVTGAGSAAAAFLPATLIPIVGPIIAGVGIALTLLFTRRRPGQKIATTQLVDELEPLLRQNLAGYLDGPRTPERQAAALRNFDAAFNWLASGEACGNPALGDPGQWCISDRSPGGKWDWFRRYRQPIANDTPKSAQRREASPADELEQLAAEAGMSSNALIGLALVGVGVAL